MDHFIKMFKKKKGKDISKDNRAVQKLRREVEKAKRQLSNSHKCKIEIESFFEGSDFSESLTRAKFEELNMVWYCLGDHQSLIIIQRLIRCYSQTGFVQIDDETRSEGAWRLWS